MKNLLFLFAVLIYHNSSYAQTVNGIPMKDVPAKYINLVLKINGSNSYNIEVFLDYGQMSKLKDKSGYIIGENGKRMSFVGVINAINYLDKKGFKLLSNFITYTPYSTLLFENTNYTLNQSEN